MKRMLKTLVAAALVAGAALPSWAQSTWNYASFAQDATNSGTYGNSWSQTQGGTKLTVTGYGNTGTGGAFATANVANWGTSSGFGVRNRNEGTTVGSPNHAMDNGGTTDLLALNFTNSTTAAAVNVVLTQITSGWHNTDSTAGGTDSDISLLRWNGTGAPPSIVGGTFSSLLTAGWVLVNNYADLTDDVARSTGLTQSSPASSWWLISAYNSAWGTGSNTANLSNGDDFMKVLASVSATPYKRVPEPSSLALVAAALLATVALRRRAQKTPR